MASKLITLVLEPMQSPNTEQPYMTNYEQSLHLGHAASVAGRGKSMQQFVIWGQFPWVHTLSFSTRGGVVALMILHDALKQEGVITILPNWLPLDGGEAPQGVPLLGVAGMVGYIVSLRDEQRQAA